MTSCDVIFDLGFVPKSEVCIFRRRDRAHWLRETRLGRCEHETLHGTRQLTAGLSPPVKPDRADHPAPAVSMVTQNTVPSHLTGWVHVELGRHGNGDFLEKKWKFLSNLRHFHCFIFGPKVFTLLLLSADITNWFENIPNNNWENYYFFKSYSRMLLLEPVPIFSIITQWPLMTPRPLRARERKVLSSPSCSWPRDLTSVSFISLSSKYHHSILDLASE